MEKTIKLITPLIFLTMLPFGNIYSCSCGEKDGKNNFKAYKENLIQNAFCHLLDFDFRSAIAKSKGKYTDDYEKKQKNFPLVTRLLLAYHKINNKNFTLGKSYLDQADDLLKKYRAGNIKSENEYKFLKQYLNTCLPAIIKKMNQLIPQMDKKTADLVIKKEELEKILVGLVKDSIRLTGSIRDLENKKIIIQIEFDSLQETAANFPASKIKSLQKKVDILKRELREKQIESANLKQNLKSAHNQIEDMKNKIEAFENIDWPEEFQRQSIELDSLTSEFINLRRQYESLHDNCRNSNPGKFKRNYLEADTVYFEIGSHSLVKKELDKLTRFAEKARSCPDCEILVEGYADSYGSKENNRKLVEYRISHIVFQLKQNKVDISRVKEKNFGKIDQGIGAEYRRVELYLIPKESPKPRTVP